MPVYEKFARGVARSEDCRAVASAKADLSPESRSELRLGVPVYEMGSFTYVYVLQSEADPGRFYTGCTRDLRARLIRHNNGDVTHTSKWKPWRIKTYIAFSDQEKARSFESYLKTSSGRAFQKKRL